MRRLGGQQEHRVRQVTNLVNGVGIVERPAAIHVRFPHVIAVLAAARFWGDTAVTATAPARVVQGNESLELGFWTDVEPSVGHRLHRLFVEPSLDDLVRDVALGLAANVSHVDAEHLESVRAIFVVW